MSFIKTSTFEKFTDAVAGIERPRILPTQGATSLYWQQFGKPAQYEKGGELCVNHKAKHDKDKFVVELGLAAGIDFNKAGTDTTYKVDCLSGEGYEQPRLRSHKFVWSYARRMQMQDSNELSAYLTFGLNRDENGVKNNNDLVVKHMTVFALDEHIAFGDPDYYRKITASRKALSKTIRDIEVEYRPLGFQVIMTREEDALNADARTLFAHYHLVVIAPRGKALFNDFIKDFKEMWGMYLFSDHVKKIRQFANYVSKPIDIPRNMTPPDFGWYYYNNLNRQKVVRRGAFQAWRTATRKKGRLTKIDGHYKVIANTRLSDVDDTELNETLAVAAEGLSDPRATRPVKERQTRPEGSKSPVNIFCGMTIPRADVGNFKNSYAVIVNYDPNAIATSVDDEMDLQYIRERAIEVYERNTGKKFCLREYLKPRAQAIYRRMTSSCDIYNSSVIIPDDVKAIVLELVGINIVESDPPSNLLNEIFHPPYLVLDTNEPPF